MKDTNLLIDSDKKSKVLDLQLIRDVFKYKDLLIVLALRDYKVRYAQTYLGVLWAFLQPLITLTIFIIVFGKGVKVNTGVIPYPVFAVSGLTLWTYFSFVLSQAGNSLIGAQNIIQKIYFPRLIIPLSKAIVGFVDFAISGVILLCFMIFFGVIPSIKIFYLPVFIILTVICSLGVGIWLSALTINHRDFQHLVPFIIQFGLYITPIAFPVSLFGGKYEWLFYFNPMAGLIEGFRYCLFDNYILDPDWIISVAMIVVLTVSGLFYFRKVESEIADLL